MRPLTQLALAILILSSIFPMFLSGDGSEMDASNEDHLISERSELEFIENLGQLDEEIDFYSRGEMRVALKGTSMQFAIQDKNEVHSWEQHFVDATDAAPQGIDETGTIFNYFIGRDQSSWVSGARSFKEIRYENIYHGTDLLVSSMGSDLKYDIILDPLTPVEQILIRFEGISELDVGSDEIIIELEGGELIREGELLVYYQDTYEIIDASFRKVDDRTYGYDLGSYDRTRTVVIDPVVFSTYIGGSTSDHSEGLVIDDEGDIYVTGQTSAWGFPITSGSYQTERLGGLDAFIVKLNEDGSDIDFCTLLGGAGDDTGFEIQLDDNGNLYVAGRTTSLDIPTHSSAYEDDHSGGWDVFLAKLNPTGTDLLTATYYGGTGTDASINYVVDSAGNSYVGGWTTSEDLLVTNNNIVDNYGGGDISGFLFKMNPMMSTISYSTYISTMVDDRVTGLDVDDSGNAYITGMTRSDSFPLTNNARDTTYSGSSESFIMKIDPTCSQMTYSSYLGGVNGEGGYGLELDQNGNIWIGGVTYSNDFPSTEGVFQPDYNDGGDIFVTQINGTDFSIMQSTFIGGSGRETPKDMTLDKFNRITICGDTGSSDLPVTDDAIQGTYQGGNGDGFTIAISGDLSDIIYSTYIGGDGWFDSTTSVESNSMGFVAFTGWSDNETIPTTEGSFDTTHNGFEDAYVMGLTMDIPPTIPLDFNARSGDSFVELSWNDPEEEGSQDLDGFQIFKKTEQTGEIEIIDLDLVNSYNDTDVENGERYLYWMRAKNLALFSIITDILPGIPLAVPSPPLGFDVISGVKQITIRWAPPLIDGGTEIIGYKITKIWNISSERTYDFTSDEFEMIDKDVAPGVEYTYTVRSINSVGPSESSFERMGIATDIPSEPLSPTVIPGNGFIVLSWEEPESDKGSSIKNYNIYRSTDEGKTRLLKTVSYGLRVINDTEVVNGVEYSYYVTAVNQIGESISSAVVTTIPVDVPSTPLFFKAFPGDGYIILEWEKPTSNGGSGITGYEILINTSGIESIEFVANDVFTYIHDDLKNGDLHSYSIRAVSIVGSSDWTEKLEAVPLAIPGAPQISLKGSGENFVHLIWNSDIVSGGSPIIAFRIFRSSDEGTSLIGEVNGDTFSYNDTSAQLEVEYSYYITALNSIGGSDPSNEITIIPVGLPTQPLGLDIQYGDGTVILTWSEPLFDGGSEIISYIITRVEEETTSKMEIDTADPSIRYEDEDVEPGKGYLYTVTAKTLIGTGSPSESFSIIVLLEPVSIKGLDFEVLGGSVELSWTELDLTGFGTVEIIIERAIGSGEYYQIARIDGVSTSFTDDNIRDSVEYSYRVTCINEAGSSESVSVDAISFSVSEDEDPAGFLILMILGTLIPLLLAGVILFFALRKRKKPVQEDTQSDNLIEIIPANEPGIVSSGTLSREVQLNGDARNDLPPSLEENVIPYPFVEGPVENTIPVEEQTLQEVPIMEQAGPVPTEDGTLMGSQDPPQEVSI